MPLHGQVEQQLEAARRRSARIQRRTCLSIWQLTSQNGTLRVYSCLITWREQLQRACRDVAGSQSAAISGVLSDDLTKLRQEQVQARVEADTAERIARGATSARDDAQATMVAAVRAANEALEDTCVLHLRLKDKQVEIEQAREQAALWREQSEEKEQACNEVEDPESALHIVVRVSHCIPVNRLAMSFTHELKWLAWSGGEEAGEGGECVEAVAEGDQARQLDDRSLWVLC